MFRQPRQNRIWFVGRYPQNYSRDNKLESIVVAQFDENQNLLRKTIHADKAYWQQHDGIWVFCSGQTTKFDAKGDPSSILTFPGQSTLSQTGPKPHGALSAPA